MIPIDNGYRLPLEIPGIFSGMAGISGNQIAFRPTGRGRAELTKSGVLDGITIPLSVQKIGAGPFYGATFDIDQFAQLRAAAAKGSSEPV